MNPISATADAQQRTLEATTEYFERLPKLAGQIERVSDIEVGMTPSEVVYTENKLELLHYTPEMAGIDPEQRHDVPILIVYALINKPYILDLQPDRSVVRRLLEAGFDVYLINWGEPSRLDSSLTLDDYVSRYTDNCVDVVRERSGQESINLLGYCMGGTMGVMYASLFPEKVRNLGLMAAGLCFDDTGGVLELWGEEPYYDPQTVTGAFGNVPADFLDVGFALMDPVSNYVSKYFRLYDNVEDDEFVENFARMERWLAEGIDVAGATYEQFIEDIYQDNKLARNELHVGDRHVDLGEINQPILQIVGHYDHLIPPESSTEFNDLVASDDVTTFDQQTGHIGLSVSSSSHDDLWPSVADWFAERSQVESDDEPADADTEPETTPEQQRIVDSDEADDEPQVDDGPQVDEAETEAEPEAETDAEPEAETDAEPEAETDAEPEVETDAEPEVETDAESQSDAELEIESEAETAEQDSTTDDTAPTPDAVDDTDETGFSKGTDQLESVYGIGPHYAEQLREVGINNVDALADADAEALAETVGVSVDRTAEWIESAADHRSES